MTYTVGSLFSGIGGLDLAAHWAGFKTSWFVEREPFCQKVLANHWPGVPIHSDVFECHDLPHVDILCGGFPCQPFSVAGNRKGADDERYLLPEMLRIIREVKPYAVLFENVPGFPSLNDGAEFKYLLRALAEMGFDAEWGHIRASDCGAPHGRERWLLVAYTTSKRGIVHNLLSLDSPKEIKGRDKTVGRAHRGKSNVGSRVLARNRRHNRPIPVTGMERVNDGLPSRLDFPGWPATKKRDQYTYEPQRITTKKPGDEARHKALGNAVVPQVAYPLFAAIHDWLTETASERVA